jgi:hypothetical protein
MDTWDVDTVRRPTLPSVSPAPSMPQSASLAATTVSVIEVEAAEHKFASGDLVAA